MNSQLEVLTLAVTDIDRAVVFYTDRVGFVLDIDWSPNEHLRVVQVTPPGSHCSVQFGRGLTDAEPGSACNTHLVVTDIEAARAELIDRGVPVAEIRHKHPSGDWQGEWQRGTDREHRDYASLADFSDPDGNTWALQEVGFTAAS
jgi:catechol 2,3-dioxygenase-like lactoylglutathione lyase family enzyme